MTGLGAQRSGARSRVSTISLGRMICGLFVIGLCATVARGAEFTFVPDTAVLNPGQSVAVEVYADGVDGLPMRAYSGWLEITGGSTGRLDVDYGPGGASFVDTTRADWLLQISGALTFGGWVADFPVFYGASQADVPINGDRKYLATVVFVASEDALGDFTVSFQDVNNEYTLLEGPSTGGPDYTNYLITDINELVVSVVEPMPNDDCNDIVLLGDGATRFDLINATLDGPVLTCGSTDTLTPDIWFEYHAPHSGVTTFSTCNDADFDTMLAIYSNGSGVCTCPTTNGDMIACNDDATGCTRGTSEVIINAVAGTCYTVRLGGNNGAEGSGTINVTCVGNDSCATAETITSLPATITGSTLNTAIDDDLGQPVCGRAIDGPGVWYTVTGSGQRMTASLCLGAEFDTAIAVYEGSCGSLTCVAGNDNSCGSQAATSWCSVSGRPYRILVHGASGGDGAFTLSVANDDCDDDNACTTDYCDSGVCVNADTTPEGSCCAPTTGALTDIDDDNPCTVDTCTASGSVTHTPGPNGPNVACEDGFTCTLDECLAGICVHPPIAGMPCVGDEDCYGGTCTGPGSTCECIERPTLYLVPRPSLQPNDTCYGVGDQLVVDLVIEEGPSPIVGGQFFLQYDPLVLDFVSMTPGEEPFTFEVFESVDEFAGTLDYTVMVAFGEDGTLAESRMATITFDVIDECTPSLSFRDHEPPTYLSAEGGYAVDPIPGELPPITSDGAVPVIAACPADVLGFPDPGEFTAVVTWPQPAPAVDSCDGNVMITCDPPSGTAFPVGVTTVTCSAEDDCGSVGTCTFDVEVQPMTLTVDLELSPVIAGDSFERCITFDLCDVDGGLQEQVSETILFTRSGTGAVATDVTIDIPGGTWDCVTARDNLHTLASQAPDLAVAANGLDYSATFTGNRELGGHWLLLGNLNGDHYVDVLDLGTFLGQFMQPLPIDTPCGTPQPHADLNADAITHLADFAVLQLNLFEAGENECPCTEGGVAAGSTGPIRSISVSDLYARGLPELAKADENGDGVVEIGEAQKLVAKRIRARSSNAQKRSSAKDARQIKSDQAEPSRRVHD